VKRNPTSFWLLTCFTVAVSLVATSCDNLRTINAPEIRVPDETPARSMAECPWYEQFPGAWCDSEWAMLSMALDAIQGDATCSFMHDKVQDWLWAGKIVKTPDLSPGTLAATDWWPDREFNTRLETMMLSPVFMDAHWMTWG
jgi:hypothetical protein